jgi:hypothetical protein
VTTAEATPTLEEQAAARVRSKTDVELAELYRVARRRVSRGSDEDRAYWRAFADAIVAEARDRPEFAVAALEGSGKPPREARKQRRALKPLFRPLLNARTGARELPAGDTTSR